LDLDSAKEKFLELVDEVSRYHTQKVIIKNNKPAALLVNVADYQAILDRLAELEEELEEIDDVRVARDIQARIANGEEKLSSLEEVEAELDGLPD
jgi:prevent-host-death family protein